LPDGSILRARLPGRPTKDCLFTDSARDGVKVDVQCILETLGHGHGGRVQLTRQYHQALDASIAKNFPENGIIACMSHNTDALYWYAIRPVRFYDSNPETVTG